MAPVSNSHRVIDRPRAEGRGRSSERRLVGKRAMAFVAALLCAIAGLLLVVFVGGPNSHAGVLGHIAERLGIESPSDLEKRRIEVRTFIIRSQLAQAKNPIVIIGDSITEAALLPSSICGADVVNAGIGGMTVGAYLPLAKQLLAGRRVRSIIVALGTNDAGTSSSSPIGSDYASLIDELSKHTSKILLAGLPPLEMGGALADRYFDSTSADRNNAAIRSLAASKNLPFINLRGAIHGDNRTVDGVHLTADAYRQWREVVRRNIYSALGCVE